MKFYLIWPSPETRGCDCDSRGLYEVVFYRVKLGHSKAGNVRGRRAAPLAGVLLGLGVHPRVLSCAPRLAFVL